MAEGTYEYECMRAELLGVDKPDYEEFLARRKEEARSVESEAVETENLVIADAHNDELKGVNSKMDELNQLLSSTQKKINSFKYRCNSITGYVKNKLVPLTSSISVDVASQHVREEPEGKATVDLEPVKEVDNARGFSPENERRSDLSRALDNHVDRLDTLLEKSESAHLSMEVQRKQMKRYLK